MDDPIQVSASGIVAAPAAAVWATVADFGTVADYLPSVVACRLEGSGIGSRRVLTTTDGGRVVSELIELDEERLVMGYRIVESTLPFEEYTSRVIVRAVDTNRCQVTWSSVLTPHQRKDGDAALDVASFLRDQLESGIEGLRRLHEHSGPIEPQDRPPGGTGGLAVVDDHLSIDDRGHVPLLIKDEA
jgi:hypothetical protein